MTQVNWEAAYKVWREYEGLRLEAYPDPATGNEPWTIGYGHTGGLSGAKVKKGDRITKEEAELYMKSDLASIYNKLIPLIKTPLNPNQWAALISFGGNLKWNTLIKSSVIKYINDGRLSEVPGRMALYRLGDGKVMNGLVRRRAAEGNLWMSSVNATQEIKDAQGTNAEPATPRKFWDWGIFGVLITTLAGLSDEVKKLIGDLTSAFGVSPLVILAVIVIGFAAYTLYNKWKGDK